MKIQFIPNNLIGVDRKVTFRNFVSILFDGEFGGYTVVQAQQNILHHQLYHSS